MQLAQLSSAQLRCDEHVNHLWKHSVPCQLMILHHRARRRHDCCCSGDIIMDMTGRKQRGS